jgi:hypothetical protein
MQLLNQSEPKPIRLVLPLTRSVLKPNKPKRLLSQSEHRPIKPAPPLTQSVLKPIKPKPLLNQSEPKPIKPAQPQMLNELKPIRPKQLLNQSEPKLTKQETSLTRKLTKQSMLVRKQILLPKTQCTLEMPLMQRLGKQQTLARSLTLKLTKLKVPEPTPTVCRAKHRMPSGMQTRKLMPLMMLSRTQIIFPSV